MTDVTEAVEVGRAAIAKATGTPACQKDPCPSTHACYCRYLARAALEAVLPLVVAGERERIAKMVKRLERVVPTAIAPEVNEITDSIARTVQEQIVAAILADTGG